jgi:hypothetical protein
LSSTAPRKGIARSRRQAADASAGGELLGLRVGKSDDTAQVVTGEALQVDAFWHRRAWYTRACHGEVSFNSLL